MREEAAQIRPGGPGVGGFLNRFVASLGWQVGATAQGEALVEGMRAEQATFDTAGNLIMDKFHGQHADLTKRLGDRERREELKRIGLEDPSRAIRDLRANRERFEQAGADAIEEWNKLFLAMTALAHTVTQRTGFRTGLLGGGAKFDFSGFGAAFRMAGAPAPGFAAFGFTPEGIRTGPETFADIDRGATRRFEGKEDPRAERVAERNAERMALAIGREIGPIIAMMSGGGVRGVVAGAGGITATLASLNDPKGNALMGAAAPWLSLTSGVLSGMSMLFGHGGQKPKMIITAFEGQALEEIKQLRADPVTTQFTVIAAPGDPRQLTQQLGRLARKGVLQRLP